MAAPPETAAEFDPAVVRSLRRNLPPWFESHKRDLPWRASRDPYRVWVSEVMLQQTTVAAVVPYFHRFLEAFPTVTALAAAEESRVLRLWEGLGYYRRARHLHAAAKTLTTQFGDVLPDDPGVWESLPGVGRYIRGAVLSQAFDRREPIVEANTLRVLARVFGYRGDPRVGEGHRWAWRAAAAILPAKNVGDFNQAMMELGALVCTPTAPACESCPVRAACRARALGAVDRIPPKKAAAKIVAVREVAIVLRDGGTVLLVQRPAAAKRWANMWEFPHGEVADREDVIAAAARILTETTGFTGGIAGELLTVRHGVTRYQITMTAFEAKKLKGQFKPGSYAAAAWVVPAALTDYAVSSPQRKIADAVSNPPRQQKLC